MGKKERLRKKKIKRAISDAVKELRVSRYVSIAIQYGAGHNALLYIFCPEMTRAQIREGKAHCTDLLMKMSGEFDMLISGWQSYPKGLYSPSVPRPDGFPEAQIIFAPQTIWHVFNEWTPPNKGLNVSTLYERANLRERGFREALILLVKAKVITVLANGFVWRRDEAKQKFGMTLHEMRP